MKFAQEPIRNYLGPYQLNSFTKPEPHGIGENQQNMAFIASTIFVEMEYVPISSSEYVYHNLSDEISTVNKIISLIDFQ